MAEGYDPDPVVDQANPLDESSFTAFYAEGERLAGTGKPYEDWLRRRDLRSARKGRRAIVLRNYNARKDLEIIAACQYQNALLDELQILSEEYSMLSDATYDSDQISDYGLKTLFLDRDQISDSGLKALLAEKSDGFISGLADQPSPVKFNFEVDPLTVTRTDSGEHITVDVIVNIEDSRPLSPSKSPYYRSRSNIRSERSSMGDGSNQQTPRSRRGSSTQTGYGSPRGGSMERPKFRESGRSFDWDQWNKAYEYPDYKLQYADLPPEDQYFFNTSEQGVLENAVPELERSAGYNSLNRVQYPEALENVIQSYISQGARAQSPDFYVREGRVADYVEEMDELSEISRNQDPLMNIQYLPDFEALTNRNRSSPRRVPSRQRLYADSSNQMSAPNISQARFECPLSPIAGRSSHSSSERNRTQNLLNRTYDADMPAMEPLLNQNNIFLGNINDSDDDDWDNFEFGDFVREVNLNEVVQEMDEPLDVNQDNVNQDFVNQDPLENIQVHHALENLFPRRRRGPGR